jgi:hypothetical protein
MPDPLQPQDSPSESVKSDEAADTARPSDADKPQSEIQESAKKTEGDKLPGGLPTYRSLFSRNTEVIIYCSIAVAMCVAGAWALERVAKKLIPIVAKMNTSRSIPAVEPQIDPAIQSNAERLLQRLAAGDNAAADQVLRQSDSWTGKIARTQMTDQLVANAINRPELHVREAAIQAQLALEKVPRDAAGFAMLEEATENPGQRAWALWTLGALGSRGVDPDHAAKIIGAYLDDPIVNNRAAAVNGLALVATDETVPMLLDRFRNDPSPIVQERAACGLSQAGMYSQEQRMVAAASMVGWLNDSLLNAQQKIWLVQALHDISGKDFGPDSAMWRRWYRDARSSKTKS